MNDLDSKMQTPIALTIAGSDSGGGAGIQADLRTFSFHQVHGTSAITCVTAQNTMGVRRVDALDPAAVIAQITAVTDDMTISAAKTGMLLNHSIIQAVANQLEANPILNLVVDPVMVSRSGDKLIDDDAIESMRNKMLPLADIATPNRHEAELLSGLSIDSIEDMIAAAKIIQSLGPTAVVIKGGGLTGDLCGVDVWFDGQSVEVLRTQFIETNHTHGTGCTFSSAIVANMANGLAPLAATQAAKHYVTQALSHSLCVGKGKGPVGHFYPLKTFPKPPES